MTSHDDTDRTPAGSPDPISVPANSTDPSPIEPDPTGVRAILAALPEPEPMPAELIERITASLAAERALAPDGHGEATKPSTGRVMPFAAARQRPDRAEHTRTGARLPSMALAASVVVLAGAVLLGVLTMLTGGLSLGGSDLTAGGAISASIAGSDSGGDSGAEAAPAPDEVYSQQDTSGEGDRVAADESAGGAATGASTESAPMSVSAAPVFASGTELTTSLIAGHALTLRERVFDQRQHQLEGVPSDSPISSPAGAADCLSMILGDDAARLVARLAAIDFVDFEDQPAAMLLLRDTGPGPDAGDGRTQPMTAYLVPADCGLSKPHTLTDPVRLDS